MSTSPKFRITVQGIAAGARAERVRQALGNRFGLSQQQVGQLLANQAGPLVGLMEHKAAWVLRSELQDLGVDCRIAPVPRSNIASATGRMALQGTDPDRRVGVTLPTRRASRQAMPMRSGKVITPARPRPAKPVFVMTPLWRVMAVVAVALLVGFSLQAKRDRHTDTIVVADSVR